MKINLMAVFSGVLVIMNTGICCETLATVEDASVKPFQTIQKQSLPLPPDFLPMRTGYVYTIMDETIT